MRCVLRAISRAQEDRIKRDVNLDPVGTQHRAASLGTAWKFGAGYDSQMRVCWAPSRFSGGGQGRASKRCAAGVALSRQQGVISAHVRDTCSAGGRDSLAMSLSALVLVT
jgi:hypothetical protein